MIQISECKYINKYQIVKIIDRYTSFEIYMTSGENFHVYEVDHKFYRNIEKLLRNGNI